MKSDIFLSEVVEKRETDSGVIDVCAVADGQFDPASSQLRVKLDAYLEYFPSGRFRPAWLPKASTVTEHVPRAEIHDVGRDIFHRWVKQVQATVPRAIPAGPDGPPVLPATNT